MSAWKPISEYEGGEVLLYFPEKPANLLNSEEKWPPVIISGKKTKPSSLWSSGWMILADKPTHFMELPEAP